MISFGLFFSRWKQFHKIKEVMIMNEGVTVLLWLVLIVALAVPFIWVVWVIFRKIKANETTSDNPPESSEETKKQ